MSAGFTQQSRCLNVHVPTLDDDTLILTRFEGREEMSRLFEFRLDMFSPVESIDPKDVIGQHITFSVETGPEERRYFNGHIKSFTGGTIDTGFREYTAEVVPWLWFLTQSIDCRIFSKKNVIEIVREVFADLDFSDFEDSAVRQTHPVREYCVQYRESDFQFISRLLEQEGIYYYFRHENGKHTLVLGDHAVGYLKPKDNEVEFEKTIASTTHENRVAEWNHRFEFRTGRWTQNDYDFKRPTAAMSTATKTVLEQPWMEKFEKYDPADYLIVDGNLMSRDDGEGLTKIRIEEEEAGYNVVHGTGGCRAFSPGRVFSLKNHPISAENDPEYVLTSVEHYAIEPTLPEGLTAARLKARYSKKAGAEVSDREYHNQFTCIPADVTFRPARITPKPKMGGVQTAVVVGTSLIDTDPDGYGRVKVHFHWERQGRNTTWLRVSHNWAGKNYGALSNPHQGQEVIVDFLDGDPDRPIIVGRVYNGENMPPMPLPRTQNQFVVRDEGGNQIKMRGCQSGQQQVEMTSPVAQTMFTVGAANTNIGSGSPPPSGGAAIDEISVPNGDEQITGTITGPVGEGASLTTAGEFIVDVTGNYLVDVEGDYKRDVEGDEYVWTHANRRTRVSDNDYLKIYGDQDVHIVGKQKVKIDGDNDNNTNGWEKNHVWGAFRDNICGGAQSDMVFGYHNTVDIGLATEIFVGGKIHLELAHEFEMKIGAYIAFQLAGAIELFLGGKMEMFGGTKLEIALGPRMELANDVATVAGAKKEMNASTTFGAGSLMING